MTHRKTKTNPNKISDLEVAERMWPAGKQGEAIKIDVETELSIRLVLIRTEQFETWAVYGPDHFGQMQYWTQPDEASARSFYTRLVKVIQKEMNQAEGK